VATHPENPRGAAVPQRTVIGQARRPVDTLAQLRCRLIVVKGPRPGAAYDLKSGDTRIGKDGDNDIVIDDPTVSRNHFTIARDGERYVVRDLGSTNGTFVDGAQVKEAYLRPGVSLEAGDVVMRFQPEQAPMQLAPSVNDHFGELVGKSLAMREIFALLERIAPTDATVLLIGETGTGKGEAAKAIHAASPKSKGPFVVVDCGAISQTLIESELFGHEKGSFTGAVGTRAGSLEAANGGTLFLDEIDDLPLELQPKLLRALEDRVFQRVGSSTPIKFNARIVAASKKDLAAEVAAARFREDLFFRISVFTLRLPALRERREDIPVIVEAFTGPNTWDALPQEMRDRFQSHRWAGNVRELRNALERVRHLSAIPGGPPAGAFLTPSPVPVGTESIPADYGLPFKEAKEKLLGVFEKEYLTRLLKKANGNIAQASRVADVDRKYLYSLLRKYQLIPDGEEN
jgi:DNA-binding NtrC family response regulator